MAPSFRFIPFTDKTINVRFPEDRPSQSFTWMGRDQASLEEKAINSPDWKIPRPHQDGRYWKPELNKPGEEVFKVGAVLCGPATLFWDVNTVNDAATERANWIVNDGMREKRQLQGWSSQDQADELKLREWMTTALKDLVEIRSPALGAAVVWNVGTDDTSAIHSEPDMSDMPDGRIFISILPGTEAQIRGLCKNWQQEYQETEEVEKAPAKL